LCYSSAELYKIKQVPAMIIEQTISSSLRPQFGSPKRHLPSVGSTMISRSVASITIYTALRMTSGIPFFSHPCILCSRSTSCGVINAWYCTQAPAQGTLCVYCLRSLLPGPLSEGWAGRIIKGSAFLLHIQSHHNVCIRINCHSPLVTGLG